MSDSAKNLTVSLTTATDTTGLKQFSDGLKGVSEAARASGSAAEEAAKKQEVFGMRAKDTRDVFKELAKEFPSVATAYALIFKPRVGVPLAAINVLLMGIESLFESIQELGNRGTPEFEGLTEAVRSQKDAMEQADLTARSYERTLKRISDSQGPALDNNRIQLATKNSDYIPGPGDAKNTPPDLLEKEETARKTAGAAAFAAGALVTDEANLKKTQEKIEELKKEHEELERRTTGWGKWFNFKPQSVLELTKKQNEIEQQAQERIAAQLEHKVDQDHARRFKTADAARAAQEDLAYLVDLLTKRLENQETPRPANNPVAQRSATFVDSLTPQQLDATGKALEAYTHGQKIDAGQKAIIDSLASLLQAAHYSTQDILRIIQDGHRGQQGLQREVQELRRAVAEVSRRPSTPIPNP